MEFKDNATGEMFDVIQDNDPDLPPGRLFGARLRYPGDPRAVSHPCLLEEEFGRRRTPAAADVESAEHEHDQAARAAPAKTTLTVPLEFKDEATGEMLDVIQDDDPGLPPEPDLQDSEDSS